MENLRVAFDDQIFLAQKRGGVSKYFVELIEHLPKFGVTPIILSDETNNLHLIESGLVKARSPKNKFTDALSYLSWRTFGAPNTTPKLLPKFDVLHHTFTNKKYLDLSAPLRLTTIHDMTPELYPEYFPLGNPHLAKKEYCSKVDGLISISESTTKDLTKVYSEIDLPPISVIHHGIGEQFFSDLNAPIDLPDKYLLFVGVRKGYKDFDLALRAFAELHSSNKSHQLVVVGGGPFSKNELKQIDELDLSEKVHHIFPSDNQIVNVYKQADALLFPSHYEGFGFPTLEAMAVGTPVVLAKNSCMEEVGGPSALYFETGNLDEFVEKINVATDKEFRSTYSKLAIDHAKKFTWEETARKTADFYFRLSKNN